MNEQKKEMESLIGTGDGWYDGQGIFHEFMQESVDAMMDSYKETLESIKKGVLYSKDDGARVSCALLRASDRPLPQARQGFTNE